MSIHTSCTRHALYNELDALQELFTATEELLADSVVYLEQGEDYEGDIMITVGGKTFAFYAGGVQATAVHAFIESIADENGYEVDYTTVTVRER